MSAVVLYHLPWELTKDLAGVAAEGLQARAIAFERRPDLRMYDLVVLAMPVAGLLDPRVFAWAATELRGKTLALLTDAGPLGEPLFWGLAATAALGGAKLYAPSFHASTGLLADTREVAKRQVREWTILLASAFPPRQYPHGAAGKREYR